MKIRIAIREQLAALVVFAVLVALAVVSIPTWIFVNNFVIGVESDGLALTASLKAARISSEIELVQTTCLSIASRLLLQQGLLNFYNGSQEHPFVDAREDLQFALSSFGLSLLQAKLYSRNTTGSPAGLLNVTASGIGNQSLNIELPYLTSDGARANLSDTDYGYPPMLYPNITYVDLGYPNPYQNSTPAFAANAFPDVRLSSNGGLLLGPLIVNETYALISITIPVRFNLVQPFILGYMTLIASARSLVNIQTTREGLGQTGTVLIIGPTNLYNRFNASMSVSNGSYSPPLSAFENSDVHFVLPPIPAPGQPDRHASHSFDSGDFYDKFALKQYPAALDVFFSNNSEINNATATLSTTNEQGQKVAIGVARPQSTLVTWAVIVEQDKSEAYAPITKLSKILLGCVFGTVGVILLLVFPCAHLSVKPIRKLKSATEKSIAPPGYEDEYEDEYDEENPSSGGTVSNTSDRGFFANLRRRLKRRRAKSRARAEGVRDPHRQVFKIPRRVEDRKHFVTDELTELTQTFNEMTAELFKQYTSLDQKVAERTRELEISKKAAEAANESKTLFIANISHELKTPLNGIMGMCVVCMEENDIGRIQQSLKTIYKSGDLLLHLLEDLLSFSKNQIGQQISLEEGEFRLGGVKSQMVAIFDKQVREHKISFNVSFVGTGDKADALPVSDKMSLEKKLPALGPAGAGRLKDMCLWGDQHRILQVLINLVSNSLKFTPAGGKVDLRIRCVGEVEQPGDESRSSSFSKTDSTRGRRSRHKMGSGSSHSGSSKGVSPAAAAQAKSGTALSINPLDPKAAPLVHVWERSQTPPPANAKTYLFEFEVEDTGPGIAEHMQDKIFEPFVQGDPGLSKKFGGTGLGLSICAQLAKLMGGTITLKSVVGSGTTFTMLIPLKYVRDRSSSTTSSSMKSRSPSRGSADGEGRANSLNNTTADGKPAAAVLDKRPRLIGLSQPFFASNPRSSKEIQMAAIDMAVANKSDQGKVRILVADDNSTNIEVVSKMLKLEDVYDVTIAKDGQEAYDLVKANMEKGQRFDVIFMDIQMPNLDGLQSTRLIRKMGYSAPIVALTAFSEESNVKECIESGMDEFLSKPIKRPALKHVLKKFATIPEEAEVTSLTRKTTPDNPVPEDHSQSQVQDQGQGKDVPAPAPADGEKTTDVPYSNGSPTPRSDA